MFDNKRIRYFIRNVLAASAVCVSMLFATLAVPAVSDITAVEASAASGWTAKTMSCTVTGKAKKIVVTWDKLSGAKKYKLQRKVKGGSWKTIKTLSSKKTKYVDTSAKSGKTYFYKVTAYNGKKWTKGAKSAAVSRTGQSSSVSKKRVLDLNTLTFKKEKIDTDKVVAWKKFAHKHPEMVDPLYDPEHGEEFNESYAKRIRLVIYELRNKKGKILDQIICVNPTGADSSIPYSWKKYGRVKYTGDNDDRYIDKFYVRYDDTVYVAKASIFRINYICK